VIRRQRHLRGRDQVQVVLGEVVDVLRGLAEEPVPCIAAGLTSDGVTTGVKPYPSACSMARLSSANSSSAPTPVR